ncbi:fasciclin domain-containing protein [Saltatorellus ferox]
MKDPLGSRTSSPFAFPSLALPLLALPLWGLATACTSGEDLIDVEPPTIQPEPDSVLDRAAALGFGQFVALAKASTHRALLESDTAVTVFAPSDAAFAMLPAGELLGLFEPGALAELDAFVGYHITTGELDTAALSGIDQVAMLGMDDAFVDSLGTQLIINDARIVSSDDGGDNGWLHGVDTVLERPLPVIETLERRGFETLAELIQLSGLSGSIQGGALTLLAPTDAAFDALPAGELDDLRDPAMQAALQDRLELHLVGGASTGTTLVDAESSLNLGGSFLFWNRDVDGVPTANGTAFESVNIRCTDGVIHVIGSVFAELPTVGEQMMAQGLMTLGSLAFAGGLEADFGTLSPLTVFGPSDLALELGLAPGVIDALVVPANLPRLQTFLRAHMVTAPIGYRSLVPGTMWTALSGDTIDVTELSGETTLNGSVGLAVRDVYASNGVLHVIDGVLDDGQ